MVMKCLLVFVSGCMLGVLSAESPNPAFEKLQASSQQELEYALWSSDADEARGVLFELTRRRTDEGCALMIKFLRKQTAQIPPTPPSLEEMKKLEEDYHATRKRPGGNHWTEAFRKATATACRLVLLDMPAADEAAKEFREELAEKWKGSEVGAVLLKLIQTEYEQAKESVRTGAVPWPRVK